MASKKPSTKQSPSTSNGFRGFININLTEDLKNFIKSKPFSDEVFCGSLTEYSRMGFKFTFGYDDYQHCFQVIGTRSDKEHPDYGILLTGRGSSPIKAYKQWLFMVTEIIGENSWETMLKPPSPDEYDD